MLPVNSSPNKKIFLDWYKLNVFGDNKLNVTEELNFVLGKGRKTWLKRTKNLLPMLDIFPVVLLKAFVKFLKYQIVW